jgi:hypothetical protein
MQPLFGQAKGHRLALAWSVIHSLSKRLRLVLTLAAWAIPLSAFVFEVAFVGSIGNGEKFIAIIVALMGSYLLTAYFMDWTMFTGADIVEPKGREGARGFYAVMGLISMLFGAAFVLS